MSKILKEVKKICLDKLYGPLPYPQGIEEAVELAVETTLNYLHNQEFKVETEVPIGPNTRGKRGSDKRVRRSKYPIRSMNVGDSFYVEGVEPRVFSARLDYWKKELGWEFSIIKEGTGSRCFRVEKPLERVP